ncbi:MAG: hypothetical protein L0312_12455 [Acidobacteria bacterium]|nr:hypothetical protein [Acidobacteriota bacterium]
MLPKDEVEIVTPFLKGFVQEPGKSLFNVSDQRLAAIDAQAAGRFKQRLAATESPLLCLYQRGPEEHSSQSCVHSQGTANEELSLTA